MQKRRASIINSLFFVCFEISFNDRNLNFLKLSRKTRPLRLTVKLRMILHIARELEYSLLLWFRLAQKALNCVVFSVWQIVNERKVTQILLLCVHNSALCTTHKHVSAAASFNA